jgi:hypothetical protein
MNPDLDTLLDSLYTIEHQRINDIHTKGKNFNVLGESTKFKGLEAYEYSYFFLKDAPAFNPGTVLETDENKEFIALTTDTSKAAHNITCLLPVSHVATAFVEIEAGTDEDGNTLYELQLSHRYLQCSFNGETASCFEFAAPHSHMVLCIGSNHYRITSVAVKDLVAVLSLKPYGEVPK